VTTKLEKKMNARRSWPALFLVVITTFALRVEGSLCAMCIKIRMMFENKAGGRYENQGAFAEESSRSAAAKRSVPLTQNRKPSRRMSEAVYVNRRQVIGGRRYG